MNTHSIPKEGGAWRTIREALTAVIGNPLGCMALGVAFLGVAGIARETNDFKKAEAARSGWAAVELQDVRDAVRDESNVRALKSKRSVARVSRVKERERVLRSKVGSALAAALADAKVAKR